MLACRVIYFFFFFQAEDGIRDYKVTGVQTCALPICAEETDECNPWRATTLEWSVSSPPPADDFGPSDPVVYRGAYEFSVPDVAEDFMPQHIAPEQGTKVRESGE